MHHEPDQLLPVQFTRLLSNQPAPILLVSTVYPGTYVGPDGLHAGAGDHAVGAEWDSYTGDNEYYEHTVHGGLDAGIDEVGAVGRTPTAGAIGLLCPTGTMGTLVGVAMLVPTGTASTFGTSGVLDVATLGAIARTPAAGTIGQLMLDGCYEQAGRSGQAGAIRRCEHAVRNAQSAGAVTTRAAEYCCG